MATKKAAKKPNGKAAKKAAPKASPAKKPAPPKPSYAPPKPAAKAAAPPAPSDRELRSSRPPPEGAPVLASARSARSPPPPAAARPPPAPPAQPEPAFVKQASFADRKAALEALAKKEGVAPASPSAPPTRPPPPFVRETSAADRKAAMEKVVVEQGVTGLLSKAPWKRGAPPPPPPAAPPVAAAPAPRDSPRVTMTKAPLEQTTGRSPPSVVILDSNALMMQFQFHIDIEKEVNRLLGGNYQMVVPQIVVDELARIAKEGAQKEALEARMAVELAKTFQIVESPGDGDTGILRVAEKMNAVVVTNDKRLRAQLRAKALPNIYMRSRAFLTIEGHIPGM